MCCLIGLTLDLKWSIVLLGRHSQFCFLLFISLLRIILLSLAFSNLVPNELFRRRRCANLQSFCCCQWPVSDYVWVLSNIHQAQNLFPLISQQIQISLFPQMSSLKSGIWRTSLEILSLFEGNAFEVFPFGGIRGICFLHYFLQQKVCRFT